MAQPGSDYTCSDCGITRPKAYVQPQHPYYAGGVVGTALCTPCIAERNREIDRQRKAQLDAMPRCEVPGCNRRATYTVAGGIGMCGRHLKAARRGHNREMANFGGVGLFMSPEWTREDLIRMAQR